MGGRVGLENEITIFILRAREGGQKSKILYYVVNGQPLIEEFLSGSALLLNYKLIYDLGG